MIGCVVVTGPALAIGLMDMPRDWVADHQLLLGLILIGGVLGVLVVAFGAAQWVLRWLERRLWIDGDSIAVSDRKGKKVFDKAGRQALGIERRNYVVRSPRGRSSSPVLSLEFPDYGRMTIGVDASDRQWPEEEIEECEHEAYYLLKPSRWAELLEALGFEDDEVHSTDSSTS